MFIFSFVSRIAKMPPLDSASNFESCQLFPPFINIYLIPEISFPSITLSSSLSLSFGSVPVSVALTNTPVLVS